MNKSEAVKRWRRKTKQRIIDSMGGQCVCCGYDLCQDAMDLHHLDPKEKEFGMGNIRASSVSWERIVKELRKCVLVCCRCHKEIHAGILNVPEDYQVFDETYLDYKELEKERTFCPVCCNEKSSWQITCSRKCAAQKSRKMDWDSIDLKMMLDIHGSYVKVGKILKVSDSAVRKRAKKLGLR